MVKWKMPPLLKDWWLLLHCESENQDFLTSPSKIVLQNIFAFWGLIAELWSQRLSVREESELHHAVRVLALAFSVLWVLTAVLDFCMMAGENDRKYKALCFVVPFQIFLWQQVNRLAHCHWETTFGWKKYYFLFVALLQMSGFKKLLLLPH